MLDLGLTALLACAGAVVLGAVAQGTVGFGLALVVSSVLLLVDERLVPAAVLVVAGALPWTTLAQEWRHVDWRGLRWRLPGHLVGTGAGVWIVAVLSPDGVGVMIAVMVLMGVGVVLRGVHVPVNRGTLLDAGGLGGVGGTTAGIGGPPLAVLYSGASGPRIRATLAAFFVIGHLVSVGALAAASAIDVRALGTGALLLPAALVGAGIARGLRPHLDAGRVRPAVLGVAAVSAVVLLVRTLA